MSASDKKQTSSNLPEPYRVGYKRPPAEHRFRKGQSGNPAGRPKGAANKPKFDTSFGMKAAEEYLRHEAYRPVTIREGEELVELPAIQAVFRAMGVSAMKGNRFAQKTMAELVAGLEQREYDQKIEMFGTAIDYKREWSERIEYCKTHGLPDPDPIPHPDDIILDPHTGGVKIAGPQTKEQREQLDACIERRSEAQEEVSYFAEKYRRSRSEKMQRIHLDNWHWEQRMFDVINDLLPNRYKTELKDRSYHADASRAGKTLAEFAEDRKRHPSERRWGDYVGE